MRLAAIAAILAVANGTAGPAHALLRGGNSDNECNACGSGMGGSMSAEERQRAMVATQSRALVSEGRDRQCGCNSRDPGNGHAGRAGF